MKTKELSTLLIAAVAAVVFAFLLSRCVVASKPIEQRSAIGASLLAMPSPLALPTEITEAPKPIKKVVLIKPREPVKIKRKAKKTKQKVKRKKKRAPVRRTYDFWSANDITLNNLRA